MNDSEVVAENGIHPVRSPDDWWSMILGTGYRGTVQQLDDKDRERVRLENLDFIRHNDVRGVEANVLYGAARKPTPPCAVADGPSARTIQYRALADGHNSTP